jgi:hypothetical protein
MIQMALMYFWAIITKLNYTMLFGDIVKFQIMINRRVFHTVTYTSAMTGLSDTYIWNMLVLSVVLIETLLVFGWTVAYKYEKMNWITLLVGASFHISIQLAGLNVAFLGVYSLSAYLLIVP